MDCLSVLIESHEAVDLRYQFVLQNGLAKLHQSLFRFSTTNIVEAIFKKQKRIVCRVRAMHDGNGAHCLRSLRHSRCDFSHAC